MGLVRKSPAERFDKGGVSQDKAHNMASNRTASGTNSPADRKARRGWMIAGYELSLTLSMVPAKRSDRIHLEQWEMRRTAAEH